MEKKIECRKKYSRILVVVYLILLTYCILFKGSFSYLKACMAAYHNGDILQERINLQLFASIGNTLCNWKNPWLIMNLLVNVALFLPWGMIVGRWHQKCGWKVAVAGILLSLLYELVQYVTGFGAFDVDDIVLNSAGTIAGYGILAFFDSYWREECPRIFSYMLIQAIVNLTYVLCSTSFHYMLSMEWTVSKAAGLTVAVCLGSGIWYQKLFFVKNSRDTESRPELPHRSHLFLWMIGTYLQIWMADRILADCLPNSLAGCGMAVVLWSVVVLLWYGLHCGIQDFVKNK